ncbi:ABC transporter permease [[Haemophilus] ducreyi]|uniref:ABC transporter permease n=1 Tax=Haemophilus ducreyi TaxID=730 RepID=UPI000655DC08|nr:iron ABC transporter permease [[Haemophilus] ducreyi]AKO46090.1 Fe3+ dicitrate ABC transporter permease [[Haemophilus] ducreyi]AKO47431.1 Fe3+ dicitrate ABC transporter permease [[Haemophilus] ducreyi]AKO47811.1 Fe3+ dicitrate ABC transporter permease [[Haemophilus] ducreyi]AKO50181.1 Fe3+ dicitrate ABC transporter permease [[Haemophilus] ducreyi]ANF62626.1 Fe3+ dicitrate ABC transporter permease [[Haemophilus] ducreyi]
MNNKFPFWLKAICIFISLPLLLPFAYILMRSYQVGIPRAVELLWRPRMWELLSNTLVLMVAVTCIAVVIGVFFAFCFERYQFWGKSFFITTMALPLCIPAFVSCFTWISLTFKVEGMWGAIMIMSLNAFPLVYLPVSARLKRLDKNLEEISLSLGKSKMHTFWYVTLPQLKPAIGASILLIALHMLIEFGAVSILNYPIFTTAIFQEYEMSFNNATAALLSSILVSICLLVVWAEMKLRGQNILYHTSKGVLRPYPVKQLTRWQQLPLILCLLTVFGLSIVIPFMILFYWLIVGNSKSKLNDVMLLLESLLNSLFISALGAILTVLCALPLVWAAVRYKNHFTIWLERIPYLLHAVPGIVIGLSLVFFSINFTPAIYQTFLLVIFAYFMLYLPMAQTTLRTSIEQVAVNLEKIAQSLGKSAFFVFSTVTLPAILSGITAAFALVFLNLMKELTATLLLTPSDLRTLSIGVWEFTSDAQYAAAAPYAFLLIIFSGIPVFLLKKYAFK